MAKEIILRDDGLGTDIGYPSSIQLEDEAIFTPYYFYKENQIRYIAGSFYRE